MFVKDAPKHILSVLPFWTYAVALSLFIYQLPTLIGMFSESGVKLNSPPSGGTHSINAGVTAAITLSGNKFEDGFALGHGTYTILDDKSYENFQVGGLSVVIQDDLCIQIATVHNFLNAFSKVDVENDKAASAFKDGEFAANMCESLYPGETEDQVSTMFESADVITVGIATGWANQVAKWFMSDKCSDLHKKMKDIADFSAVDSEPAAGEKTLAECGVEYAEFIHEWTFLTIFFILVATMVFKNTDDDNIGGFHFHIMQFVSLVSLFVNCSYLTTQSMHGKGLFHWVAAYMSGISFALVSGLLVISANLPSITRHLDTSGIDDKGWLNPRKLYILLTTDFLILAPSLLAIFNLFFSPFKSYSALPNHDEQLLWSLIWDEEGTTWAILGGTIFAFFFITFMGVHELTGQVRVTGEVSFVRAYFTVFSQYMMNLFSLELCRQSYDVAKRGINEQLGAKLEAGGGSKTFIEMRQIGGELVMPGSSKTA